MKRSNNFSAFKAASGLGGKDARLLFSRLESAGFSNPTKWHAQRAEKLLDRSFIAERQRAGKSEATSRADLNRLKREGIQSPNAWHAARYGKLLEKSYSKQREKMGVPREIVKKELGKLRREEKTPTRAFAKSLPSPITAKPKAGTQVISDMETYLMLLELYAEQLEYEEWVSSLDY